MFFRVVPAFPRLSPVPHIPARTRVFPSAISAYGARNLDDAHWRATKQNAGNIRDERGKYR